MQLAKELASQGPAGLHWRPCELTPPAAEPPLKFSQASGLVDLLDRPAGGISAMDGETRLCDIKPDGGNHIHGGWLP